MSQYPTKCELYLAQVWNALQTQVQKSEKRDGTNRTEVHKITDTWNCGFIATGSYQRHTQLDTLLPLVSTVLLYSVVVLGSLVPIWG